MASAAASSSPVAAMRSNRRASGTTATRGGLSSVTAPTYRRILADVDLQQAARAATTAML